MYVCQCVCVNLVCKCDVCAQMYAGISTCVCMQRPEENMPPFTTLCLKPCGVSHWTQRESGIQKAPLSTGITSVCTHTWLYAWLWASELGSSETCSTSSLTYWHISRILQDVFIFFLLKKKKKPGLLVAVLHMHTRLKEDTMRWENVWTKDIRQNFMQSMCACVGDRDRERGWGSETGGEKGRSMRRLKQLSKSLL